MTLRKIDLKFSNLAVKIVIVMGSIKWSKITLDLSAIKRLDLLKR